MDTGSWDHGLLPPRWQDGGPCRPQQRAAGLSCRSPPPPLSPARPARAPAPRACARAAHALHPLQIIKPFQHFLIHCALSPTETPHYLISAAINWFHQLVESDRMRLCIPQEGYICTGSQLWCKMGWSFTPTISALLTSSRSKSCSVYFFIVRQLSRMLPHSAYCTTTIFWL
jgi:hypothetical protein